MRIAKLAVLVPYLALVLDQPGVAGASPTTRVLVFSKTAGFRHDSIADGIARAREAVASGAAMARLEAFVACTRRLAADAG